ncbi:MULTISPECIES: XRE family transcriptional regulator [Afipia]|uniref:XRE family transcriptional regulator n=1 Tax=Afipia TaxID=1033 RepID=UPI001FCE4775|nr:MULTISPECIES: XRE family transcriptional regulator [Afipia]
MSRTTLTPRDLSLPRFALRRDEAAAAMAVSATKFDEWVAVGKMPVGRKIDGVVLWDVQEIHEAWRQMRDGDIGHNPFDRIVA